MQTWTQMDIVIQTMVSTTRKPKPKSGSGGTTEGTQSLRAFGELNQITANR
jgi:hypothetical protein